jgi:cobalt/nickel transport system permease protein
VAPWSREVHHVTLERWSRGDTVLQRLDARAKIIALLAFLIVLATTPNNATGRIAGYSAVLLAGIVVARLPFIRALLRAGVVLPFSITFAAMAWLAADRVRAIALVEKTYLSAAAVLLIMAVTPLPALLTGLRSLGLPQVLVSVVQLLYRYLFVISEQAQHMRLASACRGGFGKAARKSRFAAAAGALGVLFARSYLRAEGIHRAMLARGYRGELPHAAAGALRASDGLFAALSIALLIAIRAI